jgi:RNA polymerase sigma factor (sigma-70 family)
MTAQIFITTRQCLNPRWREAFENALYCTHNNFTVGQLNDDSAVYWLDVSQLPIEDRLPMLQQVVSQADKVMVMTDEQSDQEAMQVMQNGAVGYCHYLAAPEQLREIASVVAQGRLWIGAQLMQKLLMVANRAAPQAESNDEIEQQLQQLTPRERMVAIEVGKGATNKEIAERLNITERTVKAHVSVIFDKLKVRDRVKLALLINNLSKNRPLLSFGTIA